MARAAAGAGEVMLSNHRVGHWISVMSVKVDPDEIGGDTFQANGAGLLIPGEVYAALLEDMRRIPAEQRDATRVDLLALAHKFERLVGEQAIAAMGQLFVLAVIVNSPQASAEDAANDLNHRKRLTGSLAQSPSAPADANHSTDERPTFSPLELRSRGK